MPPMIGVVAAGAMGSAVAARLVVQGCTVLTDLSERSARSLERGQLVGMHQTSLSELVKTADWLLSIVPPDKAEAFAEKVFDIYGSQKYQSQQFKFVDCNAVSPKTMKRIAAKAELRGCPLVDAAIIGGPPHNRYDPTIYACSNDPDLLSAFNTLQAYGLKITLLSGNEASIGAASALKMSYAVSIRFSLFRFDMWVSAY